MTSLFTSTVLLMIWESVEYKLVCPYHTTTTKSVISFDRLDTKVVKFSRNDLRTAR